MNLTRFEVENHRGRRVPRVLGFWLGAAAVAGAVVGSAVLPRAAFQWGALVGTLLVAGAGLVDDLSPIGPRGVRNHLRALASGHMTTGILKLIVTIAAAILVTALLERPGGLSSVSAVVVIAGCTNVWNGLDVRPGRALKWFVLVVGVAIAARVRVDTGAAAGAWIASCVVLPLDLRERAMLGDAGANLLGFTAGVEVAAALPEAALLPAAIVAIGLNVVADTVTFSRVIHAVPPLRWFDALGRLPD